MFHIANLHFFALTSNILCRKNHFYHVFFWKKAEKDKKSPLQLSRATAEQAYV